MPHTLPAFLTPGGKIILPAPSFRVETDVHEDAFRFWQEAGFRPEFTPNSRRAHFNYSSEDDLRFADMQAALNDPDAQAIHCLRGGYGLTRYLDRLDFTQFLEKPKWLVGFSDVTALLLALDNLGIACVHGPMASHFRDADVRRSLIQFLTGNGLSINWKDEAGSGDILFSGEITGGNLTLLCHTLGSGYELESQGKILFLEEVGEQLYHTDRLLLQLRRAGKLEGLAGLIIGHFTEMKDTTNPFGKTVEEIVLDHAGRYGYPIVFGFPAGHHKWNLPLPFGVPVQIERTRTACRLTCAPGRTFG